MRGALARRMLARLAGGIIPADAGSTATTTANDGVGTDHPRGCGEDRCDNGMADSG